VHDLLEVWFLPFSCFVAGQSADSPCEVSIGDGAVVVPIAVDADAAGTHVNLLWSGRLVGTTNEI